MQENLYDENNSCNTSFVFEYNLSKINNIEKTSETKNANDFCYIINPNFIENKFLFVINVILYFLSFSSLKNNFLGNYK